MCIYFNKLKSKLGINLIDENKKNIFFSNNIINFIYKFQSKQNE